MTFNRRIHLSDSGEVKRFVMIWLGLTAALAGCAGSNPDRRDLWVDEHEYDTSVCPTGDDANSCGGVFEFGAAANPVRHEYLILWTAQYRPSLEATSLYARRVDARSGKAVGRPVRVARLARDGSRFFATFDVAAREYVLVTQEPASGDGERVGPVTLRRLTTTLEPAGPVRHLGRWRLMDLVAQPAGRISLVGLEGPPGPYLPADDARLALRIETLDSDGRSVRTVRVRARPGEDLSLVNRAVYDAAGQRVLVLWSPSAQYGRAKLRVAQVRAARADDRPSFVPPATARSDEGVELTCNASRGDCLVVIASQRGARTSPMQAQLVKGNALGPVFQLAHAGNPLGAAPAGRGYAVSWAGTSITAPSTVTIFDGTTSGDTASVSGRRRVAGPAKVAADPASGTRLLIWRNPSVHNSRRLMARLLR